jgi:hypothetical protein
MKYFLPLLFLCGCFSKSTSLEDVSEDAIAHKEGVTIEITPEKPRQ